MSCSINTFLEGEAPYLQVYQQQKNLVSLVLKDPAKQGIIFCSHPPVVTLGKQSLPSDVFGWEGETLKIERGGKATYHGPSQIIAYPILNLKERDFNLSGYLNALETSIIDFLTEFGIKSRGNDQRGNPDGTGVWVGEKKIASIGIAVHKWVTYHGVAINFFHDPQAFKGINPCGFNSDIMTSVEEILGADCPPRTNAEKLFEKILTEKLLKF